jgi:hypothetical protein
MVLYEAMDFARIDFPNMPCRSVWRRNGLGPSLFTDRALGALHVEFTRM